MLAVSLDLDNNKIHIANVGKSLLLLLRLDIRTNKLSIIDRSYINDN